MKPTNNKVRFSVLTEYIGRERHPRDEGPDEISSDLGAGTLTLDCEQGIFMVYSDTFARTSADEECPQLMKGGRVVYLCDDLGATQLVVQKKGKNPQFPCSEIDVQSYCVAPNGEDIYCTDHEGCLFKVEAGCKPKRLIGRQKGLAVQGFTEDKAALVITEMRERELVISALDPKTMSLEELTKLKGLDNSSELEIQLSTGGGHIFVRNGEMLTRVCLKSGERLERGLYQGDCEHNELTEDEFDPYLASHVCGSKLQSALDEKYVVLGYDGRSYTEYDDNCEYPYWERNLYILNMETGAHFSQSWQDSNGCVNIVAMNGEKRANARSRYYRDFEEESLLVKAG